MKLFGKKALLDNIQSKKIIKAYVTNNNDIISVLKKNQIPFELVSNSYFNNFDITLNHQGVVIDVINDKKYESIDEFLATNDVKQSIIVIVDAIQDPHNFGAILRTCDAFGVDAVIYKKDNQVQINELVIKTSTGAVNNLNLFKVTNLNETIAKLKDHGYWIYASALQSDSHDANAVVYDAKTVLIVGNEEHGISPLLLSKADHVVKIPMFGIVQSLNVSVATGILLNNIKKSISKK
ncbi:MAG: 23S rRNA (guanosine(2251)-2'-O)-methyltransferase RlmB [Mycoplasmataceae bacterium]|jgi:23S rRNA (guanosine2251-2'-O)-methyltransferase|nr:23S rRNA (guanosine(2251)-2'-O)-methyltransferase RlmB [Mycoplasmataceae bacterium]